MERNDSQFYVIDVLTLKQPAGKPFHVEARLRGRSPVPGSSATARHTAFIEDRVRRLRRRTSHVRAVCAANRTRETGAKSAKRSRIAETLQVAERNRQTILDRQVQSCAEAVAHAKQVAKAQSERLAQLTLSRKAALDERLRISALRRQRLLTIPRSRLLEAQSWDEDSDLKTVATEAVVCIQQWWRRAKLEPILKSFLRHKITLESAFEQPFDKLVVAMRSPVLIKTVARLMGRLGRMSPDSAKSFRNPARVFLSAYMLAAHPTELMPNMVEDEKTLSELAKNMLKEFEAYLAAIDSGSGYQPPSAFLALWATYYSAFQTWKAADSAKIIDGMIAHFMQLERLWLSVKDQIDADEQWAPRITEHQQQIHRSLSKFGDEALQRLHTERDSLRMSFDASTDPVPSSDILSTSPQVFPSQNSSPDRRSDSVSPSRTPPRTSPTPSIANGPKVSTGGPVSRSQTISPTVPTMEHADPQLTAFGGNRLSNAQLAHELVMDPDFSLKPAKRSPLEEQVRTMARRSFFDSVRQDFANNDFARHVPVFIEEIRDSLLAMMSGKSKHAENIKEVLDVALIRQQIDNKTFDILGCLSYITQKMLQLCAPIRDAAIRAIVSSADLGTAFEKILDILEDMKLDLANYRLQALRPVLQQQAVEYEQTKFNEALASGVVSLVKTKAWLEAAVASLKAINAARNPENIQLPQNRVGYEEAYNEALLGLIFSNTPVSPADMAETMLLDADRLFGFQNEAQATTIVAALVMLSKNAVRELREHRPGLTKLKETLFILLQDKGTNVDNLALHIIQTINESLARPGQTQPKISSEQETLIRNMVEKTLSYKDPVFSLLNRRIQTAIKYQLEKGQFKSESLASHGLDCVEKELQELSVRICRLAKHNKEVYAKHYDDILSKTVQ